MDVADDQGIVPDCGSANVGSMPRARGGGSGAGSRPVPKVRSHPQLKRAASKPERGSKSTPMSSTMNHTETRECLRAFLVQRLSTPDSLSTTTSEAKGAGPYSHSSAFRVHPNARKETNHIWTPQGHLVHSLHTQHPPEQLAILNTPYQQFPLRRAESEPDIHEDVKGKIRSKVSERRNNNSPIPRKQGGGVGDRGGSLKRKQSSNNMEVPVITGGSDRASVDVPASSSPSISPHETGVGGGGGGGGEDMEMSGAPSAAATGGGGGGGGDSSASQLTTVHESDSSAYSSINSFAAGMTHSGIGGFAINVDHPPVMQSASWPQPPSASMTSPAGVTSNLIPPFHSQLAQQMAAMQGNKMRGPAGPGSHPPLYRTGVFPSRNHSNALLGVPRKDVSVLSNGGSQPQHKPLGLSMSEPLTRTVNPLELGATLQRLRVEFTLQQKQLYDRFLLGQKELQMIQLQGEEQYRRQVMELEKEYQRQEMALEQEMELKRRRIELMQQKQEMGAAAAAAAAAAAGGLPSGVMSGQATGLAYDPIMLRHDCLCNGVGTHHEFSGRLQSIYSRLQATGIVDHCYKLKPRKATDEELKRVHSENHVQLYGSPIQQKMPLERQQSGGRSSNPMKSLRRLQCGGFAVDDDTVWNDAHTSNAARIAAGSVIDLALSVANGDLENGFAVVRPPGHHAESQQPMGFCYFNNVAVAAKAVLAKTPLEKVAIVDWDVHHGNGTQHAFLDHPDVLYISMHRHDGGTFFPGTGSMDEVGVGAGMGMNVNIPFSGGLNPPYGDPEYLAAFRGIVIPILSQYCPDIILVSAGFDACMGHAPNLGGYLVTPQCFGYMTKQLMSVSNGKVVLALEGGYELKTICECSEICLKALLGKEIPPVPSDNLKSPPHDQAIRILDQCRLTQSPHWECMLRRDVLLYISQSANEAEQSQREFDTVSALARLSMQGKQLAAAAAAGVDGGRPDLSHHSMTSSP